MCKKSKSEAKILVDRTKGLDSRGNVAVNTQAESSWATSTLSNLDDDAIASLKKDLKRVYDGTINAGLITKKSAAKFHRGYEKFFGKNGDLDPSGQDLVTLMLATEYDFKEAVDALNRDQKGTNKPLWEKCRTKEEFNDRGRIQGRQRRNSFVGPHAGITDHVFRQEETENFFNTEVVHAKGMFEGDPKSKTYNRFLEQGAPFIGGVSGTMQGLTMAWEDEEALDSIEDDGERDKERSRREKMAAIYMATLLAGGHHSASEMLFSAQSYGLFPDVADPLKNYPLAMKQLGAAFQRLGLPGDLTPKAGAIWRTARKAVIDGVESLWSEIADTYKGSDFVSDLEDEFETEVEDKVGDLFTNALATRLEEIADLVDDDDQEDRQIAIEDAKKLIAKARENLDEDIVAALDSNPFLPLAVRKTLSSALDQVSSLAR